MRSIFALLGLLVLTACPSFTTMHTARPIEPGTNEIGINTVAIGIVPEGGGNAATVPNIEVQLRHGINENMDFGVKYSFPLTITADLNIALINTGDFALSLDPQISPIYFTLEGTTFFLMYAFLPVIIDVVSTDTFVLSINVKGGLTYGSISGSATSNDFAISGTSYLAGGGVGFKIILGENFALMPEANLLYTIDGGGILWSGALGFLF